MTFGPSNTQSSYLPADFELPKDEGLLDFITKREKLTANILNIKENANYEKRELITAQQWFDTNTATTLSKPYQPKYSFRLTFDLVAFNGGPIGPDATTLTLSNGPVPPMTSPAPISVPNSLIPVNGFGACTNATDFIFLNDPQVYVRTNIWTNGSQTVTITNNSGSNLTQAYWVFEYIKN